jgi:hypothetical protein
MRHDCLASACPCFVIDATCFTLAFAFVSLLPKSCTTSVVSHPANIRVKDVQGQQGMHSLLSNMGNNL